MNLSEVFGYDSDNKTTKKAKKSVDSLSDRAATWIARKITGDRETAMLPSEKAAEKAQKNKERKEDEKMTRKELTRKLKESQTFGPDLVTARGLIGNALHNQASRQEYFDFLKGLRAKHGADYSTNIHKQAAELAKSAPAPLNEATGIPGNDAWNDAVQRAKESGERAGMLYNMFQNIPKRHFYDFVKAVGAEIDPKFERELLKAKQVGIAKNLRQDRNIVREEENPKDVIKVDVPLFIRLLEYAREDAKTDMDLHNVTERIISLSEQGKTLTMSEYNSIVGK